MKSKSLLRPLAAVSLIAFSHSARAADQFWNPTPSLSADWDTTATSWAATSGGAPTSAWVPNNDAVFDQPGTYTATLTAAQTANSISVSAGNVTFAGSAVSSNGVVIAAGATLNTTGDRIAKAGTTPLTVNGTLDFSAGAVTGGHYVQLSGTGTVIGTFRHSGDASFAGNIQDVSPTIRAAVVWNGGTGGTLTLSGNNNGATGDVLLSVNNSVLKAASASAIGTNSVLRLEGTTTNSVLVELAAADLTRAYGTGSSTGNSGNGGLNWTGSGGGFYATGADRNLTLTTTAGGSTPASVVWNTNGISPVIAVLGAAAATNTLTWTNDIDFAGAVRTINAGNGSAAVDAKLSGVLSGAGASGLTKSGAGTLELSGSNNFNGAVAVTSGGNLASGWLRLSNSNALGLDATVKTISLSAGTGTSTGGIELIGGVTITNKNLQLGGRSADATDRSALRNVSGNNAWNGNVTINNSGGTYFLGSQAGRLELGGNLANQAGGTRAFNLIGAGDFLLSGSVTDGSASALTSVTMSGAGTATFTGNGHTYSGGTTVNSGVLIVNGVLANTSVTIATGATLGGSGGIGGNVSVAGILAPGNSIESLATGSIAFTDGSTFQGELDSSAINADLVASSGAFTLAGTVTLTLTDLTPGTAAPGSKLSLLSYTGGWDASQLFTYNGSPLADDSTVAIGANQWLFNYNDTTGGTNFAPDQAGAASFVTLTAVPEPAAAMLGAIGLLALLRRRRA